jgi:SAM-dependent methyltransferase
MSDSIHDPVRSSEEATAEIANNVACPCCGQAAAQFLPFGQPPRPGARCPHCGCLERHRMMWHYLQEHTEFFQSFLRVLHFAPEPFFRQAFQELPNLDYLSADLSMRSAAIRMDITAIPLDDACMDVVLCSHVLEHIEDDRLAMREIFRVLKPGGWAILLVPIDHRRRETFEDRRVVTPEDRLKVFGQRDHVRIYGQDYADRLAEAGFNVQAIDYVAKLGTTAAEHFGLNKNELIHRCDKARSGLA